MTGVTIRVATPAEFGVALDWAAQEGWNPGPDDLTPFFAADPAGFLMGFDGDRPVSSISVVRYGDDYGFLGFYIVDPGYRGNGHGMAIWQAGMAHLTDRTIGLDGVVDQQDNYRKSGFAYAGRTIRYSGVPEPVFEAADNLRIESVAADYLPAINRLDAACFPAPRPAFLKQWLLPGGPADRWSFVLVDDSGVSGYATVRKCMDGYKVGPVMAPSSRGAAALLRACSDRAGADETLIIDIPEANRAAVTLAANAGLMPVFETARMYRGPAPALATASVFGVTTLELG